jgi:TPR repeat protein
MNNILIKSVEQELRRYATLVFVASLSTVGSLPFLLCSMSAYSQDSPPAYDQLVGNANNLLKDGKLDEAQQAVEQAMKLDKANYLAYAVAAKIASRQGNGSHAKELVDTALILAPDSDKDKIRQLAAMLVPSDSVKEIAQPVTASGDDQLKHDGLMRILADAAKSDSPAESKSLFRQFLARSVEFANDHPDQLDIWVGRAYACVELDYPGEGWLAGKRLTAVGATHSDDAKIRSEMVELESKGWLSEQRAWRDWGKWSMDQAQAAGNDGDEEAQEALGDWYRTGRGGLSQDYAQACQWYHKAADQGDAESQDWMGVMCQNGTGLDKDYAQAVNWYRKAAEQGNPFAQCNLANMYQNGTGVDKDYAQAAGWYRKSAEQGHAGAQYSVGNLYENGMGVGKDYAQAVGWYRKSADQGNSMGQAQLGWMYQNGWGVDKDDTQAVAWYRKSAGQGHLGAEDNLGWMYQNGMGVDKDYAQAAAWYRKAAEQGNSAAQNSLGFLYQNGWGVDQDYRQALAWYRKSAEQGNARSENGLGACYDNGWGVEQNHLEALQWCRKAAEQGDAEAEKNLGNMYERGRGVEQDSAQAVIWYRKAAAQGETDAQASLKRLNVNQ